MLKAVDSPISLFTRREVQDIRCRAAKNGYAVNESDLTGVETRMTALMKALPSDLLDDMYEWITTGKSKLTHGPCPPALRQQFSEVSEEDPPTR
jgi:hypothetical protein